MIGQFSNAGSNSVNREYPVNASISALLLGRFPAAIAGIIRAIIIDSSQRVPRRSITHIGKEILKLIPALANADTPATVILPVRAAGYVASGLHFGPKHVNLGKIALSCESMLDSLSIKVCAITAAGCCAAILKCHRNYMSDLSAITKALVARLPVCSVKSRLNLFNDKKSRESLSSKGYFSRHGICTVNVYV